MATLENRVAKLETPPDTEGKPLPQVVADETTDTELQRLRRGGHEVYRFSDVVELFA